MRYDSHHIIIILKKYEKKNLFLCDDDAYLSSWMIIDHVHDIKILFFWHDIVFHYCCCCEYFLCLNYKSIDIKFYCSSAIYYNTRQDIASRKRKKNCIKCTSHINHPYIDGIDNNYMLVTHFFSATANPHFYYYILYSFNIHPLIYLFFFFFFSSSFFSLFSHIMEFPLFMFHLCI